MTDWERDKHWSDLFTPAIKQAVGPHLLIPAPLILDQKEVSDLIVLDAKGLRIAARVRRHDYFVRYPGDFTIRSGRDSGAVTEMAKIMDGFGDWMFYGFATPAGDGRLQAWRILDLDCFRRTVARIGYEKDAQGRRRGLPGVERRTRDGATFWAFRIAEFPQSTFSDRRLVIAEHGFDASQTVI